MLFQQSLHNFQPGEVILQDFVGRPRVTSFSDGLVMSTSREASSMTISRGKEANRRNTSSGVDGLSEAKSTNVLYKKPSFYVSRGYRRTAQRHDRSPLDTCSGRSRPTLTFWPLGGSRVDPAGVCQPTPIETLLSARSCTRARWVHAPLHMQACSSTWY